MDKPSQVAFAMIAPKGHYTITDSSVLIEKLCLFLNVP